MSASVLVAVAVVMATVSSHAVGRTYERHRITGQAVHALIARNVAQALVGFAAQAVVDARAALEALEVQNAHPTAVIVDQSRGLERHGSLRDGGAAHAQ